MPWREHISPDDPDDVFRLTEILATGAYGSVYKAVLLADDREVAVKIVAIDDDDAIEELMVEVLVLERCSAHHNVVAYYGAYEKDDEMFIVMELCAGGSTYDMYTTLGKPFLEPQIAYVVKETLSGLQYLHEQLVIHRDIKAANLLVCEDGQVKLVDFGISAVLAGKSERRHSVIGTPLWMAPEVIDNTGLPRPYDERVDVWGLGIVCLELAELQPPLNDVHPMGALTMIPTRPAPRLANEGRWSPEFADFVRRCLCKDPEQRPRPAELLQHPFLAAAGGPQCLLPLIAQRRNIEDVLMSPSRSASGSLGGLGAAPPPPPLSDLDFSAGSSVSDDGPPPAVPGATLSSLVRTASVGSVTLADFMEDDDDDDDDEDDDDDDVSASTVRSLLELASREPLPVPEVPALESSSEDEALPPPIPDSNIVNSSVTLVGDHDGKQDIDEDDDDDDDDGDDDDDDSLPVPPVPGLAAAVSIESTDGKSSPPVAASGTVAVSSKPRKKTGTGATGGKRKKARAKQASGAATGALSTAAAPRRPRQKKTRHSSTASDLAKSAAANSSKGEVKPRAPSSGPAQSPARPASPASRRASRGAAGLSPVPESGAASADPSRPGPTAVAATALGPAQQTSVTETPRLRAVALPVLTKDERQALQRQRSALDNTLSKRGGVRTTLTAQRNLAPTQVLANVAMRKMLKDLRRVREQQIKEEHKFREKQSAELEAEIKRAAGIIRDVRKQYAAKEKELTERVFVRELDNARQTQSKVMSKLLKANEAQLKKWDRKRRSDLEQSWPLGCTEYELSSEAAVGSTVPGSEDMAPDVAAASQSTEGGLDSLPSQNTNPLLLNQYTKAQPSSIVRVNQQLRQRSHLRRSVPSIVSKKNTHSASASAIAPPAHAPTNTDQNMTKTNGLIQRQKTKTLRQSPVKPNVRVQIDFGNRATRQRHRKHRWCA